MSSNSDQSSSTAPDSPSAGYGEALEELEELLDELEASDVDVDVLAERVARGVELVRFCRARLEVVTEDVDAVVSELISVDPNDLNTGDPQDTEPPEDTE